MNNNISVKHRIQKQIIDSLRYQEKARFRELRPPKLDTNAFSYHLTSLLKVGLLKKDDDQYTLGNKGLAYIERAAAEDQTVLQSPRIITILLIQNSDGDVLLERREKQPYINSWTLPYGRLHVEDHSVPEAASREAWEKLGLSNQQVTHAGDCYIRVNVGSENISTTLAHVFRFNRDNIGVNENLVWARPHKLASYKLAPAVQEIVARSFFGDESFFEEFNVEWS